MTGRYVLSIDLREAGLPELVLEYGDYSRAMVVRNSIQSSIHLRHVLSDPAGKVEAEGKGEGNEPDRDQR